MVDCLRDTATIPNAEQLARTLIARIAIAIPAYWLALMRPSITAAAAVAATAHPAVTRPRRRNHGFTVGSTAIHMGSWVDA